MKVQVFVILCFSLVLISAQQFNKVSAASSHASALPDASSFPPKCPYTSGDIFGAIVVSVVVTIVIIGLTLLLAWVLWKENIIIKGYLTGSSKQLEESSLARNDLVAKDVENGHRYAFDNPYFKDDDLDGPQNGHIRSSDSKQFDNSKGLLRLPVTCIPNQKQLSLPDIKKTEHVTVSLTGHDFTGLGFNITGNMRDGIFVRDVLSRGPANESGLIKAGDRIINVTVSFEKMVYEDALTILSYASPYNVQIQLEKNPPKPTSNITHNFVSHRRSAANESSASSGSCSKRLLHPLYRSHSVEDLSRFTKQPSLNKWFGSVKRNNLMHKIKSQILNRSSHSSKSSSSLKSKQSHKESPPRANKETRQDSLSEEKSAFTIENKGVSTISKKATQTVIPHSISNLSKSLKTDDISLEITSSHVSIGDKSYKISKMEENLQTKSVPVQPSDPPPPAPRKLVQRKGKAPKPPNSIELTLADIPAAPERQSESPSQAVETMAQIHHESLALNETLLHENKPREDIPDSSKVEIDENVNYKNQPTTEPARVGTPTGGKLKSCSLSDLSTVRHKNKSNGVLPERAVSLDFKNQILPEENLFYVAQMDDSEGLVHWETKPNVLISDSISTAYSSDVISDSFANNNNVRPIYGAIANSDDCMDSINGIPSLDTISASSAIDNNNRITSMNSRNASESGLMHNKSNILASKEHSLENLELHSSAILEIMPDTKVLGNQTISSTSATEDERIFTSLPPNLSSKYEDTSHSIKSIERLKEIIANNDVKLEDISKSANNISRDTSVAIKDLRCSNESIEIDKIILQNKDFSHSNDNVQIETYLSPVLSLENDKASKETLIQSEDGHKDCISDSEKEDYEINENELSQIMMSHKEYVDLKKHYHNGPSPSGSAFVASVSKVNHNGQGATVIPVGSVKADSNLEFESWSYLSDVGDCNSFHDHNTESTAEPRFKTLLEVSNLNDSDAKNKVPGVAGVTLKPSIDDGKLIMEAGAQSKF